MAGNGGTISKKKWVRFLLIIYLLINVLSFFFYVIIMFDQVVHYCS